MTATLRIDQVGLPAGTPGVSRDDGLDTGAELTFTNTGGGSTTRVSFLWVPPEDTTAVSTLHQVSTHVWKCTPTSGAVGRYRVELVVDEGLPTESRTAHTIGMPMSSGLVIPAANELASPTATIATATDATLREASESNAPFAPFVGSQPFGWWSSLRDLFVKVNALLGGSFGGVVSTFASYEDAGNGGGWLSFDLVNPGAEFLAIGSLSMFGFPSMGVVAVVVDNDLPGNILCGRFCCYPGTGLNMDSIVPIVIEFRVSRAIDPNTGTHPADPASDFAVGIAGGDFGTTPPSDIAALAFLSNGTVVLRQIVAGVQHDVVAAGVPSSDVLQVRLTVRVTGVTAEVSGNNGQSYVVVATSVTAPVPYTYFPFIIGTNDGAKTGKRLLAVDWHRTSSKLDGDGAGWGPIGPPVAPIVNP